MTEIYFARWVLPISAPAIKDGAIAIDGDRIVGVGTASEIRQRFTGAHVTDFTNAAILPGLVNAHSHLELTVMRGFLEHEENNFFAWLRKLTIARMAMSPEDLYVSAMCGAIEAARAGVTCLGDAGSSAPAAMKALHEIGLRGIVYQESFGPDPANAKENIETLRRQLDELHGYETELVRAGLSPHAVYTVNAPQLELISRLALDEKLPVMMHAAESRAEELFMREGAGPFAEGLARRGIDWQAPGISTIQYLSKLGVLETKPLLAHCVTVDDTDIETLGEGDARIAHCPKSNAKLGHGRAPFAKFIGQQLKVGLGSDSVASNNVCDILEEARFATLLARTDWGSSPRVSKGVAFHTPDKTDALPDGRATAPVTASDALLAATLGGARALGLDDQIGSLVEDKQADVVVVGLTGAHQQPIREPSDALIFSSSGRDVLMTIVAGKEIYRDGRVNGVDEDSLRIQMAKANARLDSVMIR